jgi:hypothetical protein
LILGPCLLFAKEKSFCNRKNTVGDNFTRVSIRRKREFSMKGQIPKIKLRQHIVILLFVIAGIALAIKDFRAREQGREKAWVPEGEYNSDVLPITPVPLSLQLDGRKVRLGERLYNDPRLSHDNSISCATCHELDKGGTDQMKTSKGINGQLGPINSPGFSRDGGRLSCILMDIDRFKKVNDTHGHGAGDKVLQKIAEVIESGIRHSDIAGRYGGEEFLVLLPNTSQEEAFQVAEKLRAEIEAEISEPWPITASFGVCSLERSQPGVERHNTTKIILI